MSLFPKSQHLVIAGAGYAGLPLALRLGKLHKRSTRNLLRITLVNPEPTQQLNCEFYRTLRNLHRSSLNFLPSLRKLGIEFRESRVHAIYPEKQYLELSGTRDKDIRYDQLVLATGLQPRMPDIEGIAELIHSERDRIFVYKSQSQVQALRLALKRLRWTEESAFDRDRFVVILGGGHTGIEVAGEIAALRERNPRARVLLIEEAGSLLAGESPIARRMLLTQLRKMNIEFILGSPAIKMDSQEIELKNGQMIPWDLLVLCAGGSPQLGLYESAFPHAIVPTAGLQCNKRFEISAYPNHFAVGDLAAPPLSAHSDLSNSVAHRKSFQFAQRSAHFLANNLAARLRITDREPEESASIKDSGFFLSVGPSFGIARLGKLPESNLGRMMSPFIWGPRANQLKRLNELRYRKLIEWSTKLPI